MCLWRNNIPTWLSFIIFQSGWFLIVAGSQNDLFWLILPVMFIYLLLERRKQRITGNIYVGRLLILLAGFAVDYGLTLLEFIRFSGSVNTPPVWFFLLWSWFAINFADSFGWLKNKKHFAVSLGAIFGPLAYFGASKISDIVIISPIYFSLVSGAFWGTLFFVVFNKEQLKKYFFKY